VVAVLTVNALVIWSLLAVGAVYPWGAAPIAVVSTGLAIAVRPRLGGTRALAWLDAAIVALLLGGLAQLVPLPRPLLARLSPNVAAFESAVRVDAAVHPAGPHALSLDPPTTAYTLALLTAIALLFWTCRQVLASGGVRTIVRTTSVLGLLVTLIAIVQRAVAPGYVYGVWKPLERGARPIGPVVNANQLAAWLLLALPIAVGYLVAHMETHGAARGRHGWQARVRWLMNGRLLLLASASLLMTLGVFVTGSRSALAGLAVAAAFGSIVGGGRTGRQGRWTLVLFLALAVLAVSAWANLDYLAARLNQLDSGIAGRSMIWRDTLSVAGRFWLTGVGLGGYQAAMTLYQAATREVFYNHAHSQYLQVAVEGGVLLAVPAGVALVALVAGAREALGADRSPLWSLRVGAASGLVAVAVQSIWETVLRMPANGVLLAVSAAILLHRPGHDSRS
jgi:putative inorganic carbon (HCO3(-)) transporter